MDIFIYHISCNELKKLVVSAKTQEFALKIARVVFHLPRFITRNVLTDEQYERIIRGKVSCILSLSYLVENKPP
jgi:hypothetical protein